jgi:hypothetical protein
MQFQLLVLSRSILLNMVLFSPEKVLHLVEMTLDLNIELLEVTIVKGGVDGIWK